MNDLKMLPMTFSVLTLLPLQSSVSTCIVVKHSQQFPKFKAKTSQLKTIKDMLRFLYYTCWYAYMYIQHFRAIFKIGNGFKV